MFVNKLKMDEIAEAVKKCMAEDDLEETGLRKAAYAAHTKGEKMFTFKGKTYPVKVQGEDVSYGEAVKEETEIDEAMSGEVTRTKTGLVHKSTKAYGGSKPEKHVVDTLKGPKTKDLMKQDKEAEMKTRGKYDEESEFKNKLIEGYKVKKEELKGDQHKIDKNKNNKIDSQDFAILRAQQKEEVELDEKEMTAADKAERERIVKGMKKGFAGFRQRYGKRAKDVMYATATKQAMKEESVEEEINPNVRTKDTLKGQEPTSQKDDVGPGSDAKSTKVKYRGGPMKEEVKKSDIPAFIRKARGDKPLTVADAKAGRKDSISSKENLAKARGVQEGKQPESDTVPFVTNTDQPPFDKPYTTSKGTVTDKSGAKHTPMSRARDLARQAMKRIKTEMLGKAPGNNG